jgi:threonine/homoserine/homoserine lactone efflux protein
MDIRLVIQGFALGFSIAAPVGPIGVLCIRRTLADGRLAGLASGLGAATADAFYGALAAFGLTAISSLLVGGQFWLRLVGGAFLIYLGARTYLAAPAAEAARAGERGAGLLGAYASTLFLTLTNPLTILSFAAIFAGFGLGAYAGFGPAVTLVLGVFLGSALWWLMLSGGVSLLRSRFDARARRLVNRVSGLIILALGVAALLGLQV